MRTHRLLDRPIITPDLDPTIGVNIQGPSMIRVPDWIGNRLGEYYLYFADHKGSYIRLAYANHPMGPWAVPGSLHLAQSHFLTEPPVASREQVARFEARLKERGRLISHDALAEITTPHIASPDVHVDGVGRRIVMYFHGLEDVATQVSRLAISHNGIDFEAQPEILGPPYLRIFPHRSMTYAMAMPGQFFRSKDGLHGFEKGPVLFNPNMRHSAVLKRGNELLVFWTQVGEAPELFCATASISAAIGTAGKKARLSKCCGLSAHGRAPTRRSSRRCAAPPMVTSTSFAIRRSSRKTGRFTCYTRWPAKAASPLPKSGPRVHSRFPPKPHSRGMRHVNCGRKKNHAVL